MKNFDDMLSKDRQFSLGGETFHWNYQRPEALAMFSEKTDLEGYPLVDAQILLFIPAEEHDRYRAVRERDVDAIPGPLLMEILQWLVEQQSEFPTEQPSPLASGRGKTVATSKAA